MNQLCHQIPKLIHKKSLINLLYDFSFLRLFKRILRTILCRELNNIFFLQWKHVFVVVHVYFSMLCVLFYDIKFTPTFTPNVFTWILVILHTGLYKLSRNIYSLTYTCLAFILQSIFHATPQCVDSFVTRYYFLKWRQKCDCFILFKIYTQSLGLQMALW